MITVLTIPIPTETDDRTTKRQCERTATLSLAQQVAGPQATIAHHPDGAPYIPGFCRHISVTHCRTIAAMAVADIPHIGIDAETSRPQLQRVASKYLSASELPLWSATPHLLLLAWTIKEAVYKAARTPGLPLHHIRLPHPQAHPLQAATPDGRTWLISHTLHIPGTVITTAILSPTPHH